MRGRAGYRDAGTDTSGITQATRSSVIEGLAAGTRVCSYDRAGGGFDVYHHAGRYPDEVVGLVLLDVPAGQDIPTGEVPAWDSPENPEHMDYVAVERFMALQRGAQRQPRHLQRRSG